MTSKITKVLQKYHNLDPIARLIGPANETFVNIEGESYLALIDSGAQLSALPESLVKKLKLKIHHLDTLIEAEAIGGSLVPYTGYVEARLSILGIKAMNQNLLFMVVKDTDYTNRVPVQLGTLHIDEALALVTRKEYRNLSVAWARANFPPQLVLKSAQIKESEFDLGTIKGKVKLTKSVTLAPFETKQVPWLTECTTHFKRVHVITEALEKFKHEAIKPICTYSELRPGSSRVLIGLRKLSCKSVTLKPRMVVAKVSAANIVPFSVAPNLEGKEKEELREQYEDQIDSQTIWDMENQENNQAPESEIKLEPLSPEKEKLLFEKVDRTGISKWDLADQEEVREFKEYGKIFALDDLDLGHTSIVKHEIKLNDYTPFKERCRRIPPHQYDEVKKHLKEMLEIGAIRKSNSPWASAVVLVRKKDGSLRFCIDLHKLNSRTIKDAYSLPRIDETLDCLGGSIIFTSLDLKSGYCQVEMDEMSKQLTAFTVGPLGFYVCERMPFGLNNAPATFQRLMESCLEELHLNWCIIYLDDIIVFSKTPKEHIERLRGVFNKLVQAGLKLKPKKCEFFKSKISYLGHVVSPKGIETDPRKVEAVRTWVVLKTVTDIRSFLRFTNYYRRFIKDYGKIAKPLNTLISGENASKKRKPIEWNDDCQEAFNKLKELCTSTPILAYADYKKEFQLHADASELGLGGVLYQKDEKGVHRVIAYASQNPSHTERNYPTHKLEFLALKWAIMDQFHEYLYGGKFDVYTDNNPLTYILSSAKLDAYGQRWVASLVNYDF